MAGGRVHRLLGSNIWNEYPINSFENWHAFGVWAIAHFADETYSLCTVCSIWIGINQRMEKKMKTKFERLTARRAVPHYVGWKLLCLKINDNVAKFME